MKRSTELFILLSSVFKWLILGSGVGVVVLVVVFIWVVRMVFFEKKDNHDV